MTDVDVLIIGAGPTGLVAAIDARRHGLSVRIVDQSPQRSPHSKALVLRSRSLEVLDDLGCVEAVLQAGREFRALNIVPEGRPVGRVEFRQLAWGDALYPMWLTIPQSETEREAQAATAVARTFAADAVEVVWVRREASSDATNLPDPDGAIRRAFGAHRPVAVWVRPDKYVGFRGDPRSTGGLRSYLGGVFSIAALPPQATSRS